MKMNKHGNLQCYFHFLAINYAHSSVSSGTLHVNNDKNPVYDKNLNLS